MTPAGAIAIDQNVFELLFKETDAVLRDDPEWIGAIAEHLPLAGDGAAPLEEKALKSNPTAAAPARDLRARPPRQH